MSPQNLPKRKGYCAPHLPAMLSPVHQESFPIPDPALHSREIFRNPRQAAILRETYGRNTTPGDSEACTLPNKTEFSRNRVYMARPA